MKTYKEFITEGVKMKKAKNGGLSVGDNILITGKGRDGNGNSRLYYTTKLHGRNKSIQVGEFKFIDIDEINDGSFKNRSDFQEIMKKIKLYNK